MDFLSSRGLVPPLLSLGWSQCTQGTLSPSPTPLFAITACRENCVENCVVTWSLMRRSPWCVINIQCKAYMPVFKNWTKIPMLPNTFSSNASDRAFHSTASRRGCENWKSWPQLWRTEQRTSKILLMSKEKFLDSMFLGLDFQQFIPQNMRIFLRIANH